MTNPSRSLPALRDLLQMLAKISLYKINWSKSCMLDTCLNHTTKQIMSRLSPRLPPSYLGIQLTVPSYNTLRINMEKLLGKPKDRCSTMGLVKTSWAGKIALSKNVPHGTYSLPFPHLSNYLFGLSHNHNPANSQRFYLEQTPQSETVYYAYSNKICWNRCTRYKIHTTRPYYWPKLPTGGHLTCTLHGFGVSISQQTNGIPKHTVISAYLSIRPPQQRPVHR